MVALAAISLSALLIIVLGLGDPKRRRMARAGDVGAARGFRQLMAFAVCLPGAGLLIHGDADSFLIWLGSCVLTGWFVALTMRSTK